MPENFLTKQEVEDFCKKLDNTISYLGNEDKIEQPDESMLVESYHILKKLEEILND